MKIVEPPGCALFYRLHVSHGYNQAMPRYLQSSIRSLVVLTALAAVTCLVMPTAVEQYRKHQSELAVRSFLRLAQAKASATPVWQSCWHERAPAP